MSNLDKSALRQQFRHERQQLSETQQLTASKHVLTNLKKQQFFKAAENIALYLPNDGEVSLNKLLDDTGETPKRWFLPCVTPTHSLRFREYQGPSNLRRNRYGIAEPLPKCPALPNESLDLVLLPLVAFDKGGRRLGMGGGYYDRSFAFKHKRAQGNPVLVGTAHDCQKADSLPNESWDVPLDYIVTDTQIIKCKE